MSVTEQAITQIVICQYLFYLYSSIREPLNRKRFRRFPLYLFCLFVLGVESDLAALTIARYFRGYLMSKIIPNVRLGTFLHRNTLFVVPTREFPKIIQWSVIIRDRMLKIEKLKGLGTRWHSLKRSLGMDIQDRLDLRTHAHVRLHIFHQLSGARSISLRQNLNCI